MSTGPGRTPSSAARQRREDRRIDRAWRDGFAAGMRAEAKDRDSLDALLDELSRDDDTTLAEELRRLAGD